MAVLKLKKKKTDPEVVEYRRIFSAISILVEALRFNKINVFNKTVFCATTHCIITPAIKKETYINSLAVKLFKR